MKLFISVFILFINFLSLICQDIEAPAYLLNFKRDGVEYTNHVLIGTDTNKFTISTQWGGIPKILKLLKFNINEDWRPNGDQLVANVDSNYHLYHIWQQKYAFQAQGFQFEPTLYIPPNKRGGFNIKPRDTTKAVYG